MSNCHSYFVRYRTNLDIPPTTFNRLKTAQTGVERQLKKYFKDREGYTVKDFKVQGSKSLRTMIRKQNDTVDIDFGIYFYPKPDVMPATLMKKVHDAVYELQTLYGPRHLNKCIRVQYIERSKIHMDIPVFYYEQLRGDRNPHMATKEGWIRSDTTEFEKWYNERKHRNPQLRHIVRYLKGWATTQAIEMPKGVALTVLAATHHVQDSRDDISLLSTLKEIRYALEREFYCEMPAEPRDDLLRKMKSEKKQLSFFKRLDAIIADGEKAIKSSRNKEAIGLWGRHLGKHFPKY